MRTVLSIVAATLLLSACASGESEAGSPSTTVVRECSVDPASPLDVKGEPDWRRYADYSPWTDVDGCLVRIDVLAERSGPDHCGWEDTRVIITGDPFGSRYGDGATGIEYVRDPHGVYGVPEFVDGFATMYALPDDAIDTGYRQGERQLWLSPGDPEAIYIRATGSVERWPRGAAPKCF